MSIDVTKENLCINKIIGQKSETMVVEGDIIVPDIKPDILNTINTTGNVCTYKREVLEGKIRLDGNVNLYIMYLADNEEEGIRSITGSLDFTQVMDFENCNINMSLEDKIKIKSIECKVLNGRKINIKVTLNIEAKVYSNENIDIIKQINNLEDIQSLESTLQINSLTGEGSAKTYAKDTIMLDNIDNLAEILKTEIEIINKDIKISYNKVLAKSDVGIKIMYLTEDNRIKVTQHKIPAMGFVDIENIEETDMCDMEYTLKNVVIKPNQVEEHSIYVEAEIELYCRVYKNKEIQLIQDLYSPSEELCFNQKTINTMSNKNFSKSICNIREKVSIPEINGNQIYDVEVRPVIFSQKALNSKIMYEGEIELNFIYSSNNVARIDTRQTKIPLNYSVEIETASKNSNIETQIEIKNNDFIIGTDGYIESKIDLEFAINMSSTINVNIIDEVKIEEARQREIYSMIIYFVKPKDTLWNIAKRFKSTVADIVRVNNIEDENKIYPGQQLFIPKYVYIKKEISA
ncbi:MAG: DUF3794 domain-containing protein [Clostridia bacterium]|jgi:hypothetical protein|nr:DUF3794 domain-containing protein [Clostridia bacterium]